MTLDAKAKQEAQEKKSQQARANELASLSPNSRRIEQFIVDCSARTEQLRGGKEKLNADYHNRARKLARDAFEGVDWTPEEKHAAANAIAAWLPKVVERIDKDELKKLKLSALRSA